MLNLEQARQILDHIVSQTRLTREEHSLASQSVQMLYDGAKEHAEDVKAMGDTLAPGA